MSQRILLLNPWGVDNMDAPTLDVVAPRVRPDTDVEVRSLGADAPPVPWPSAGIENAITGAARQAEADGFDGIVIACCADPYLSLVRQSVSIPVSAPTESAVYAARAFGKIAILARQLSDEYLPFMPTQGNWDFWNSKALEYGLQKDDYALRRVRVPKHVDPDTLARLTTEDPARLRDLTIEAMTDALLTEGVEQANAAVAEDGAKAIFFACAFWSPGIDALGADASRFDAPVLNPLVTAATFVEHVIVSQGQYAPTAPPAA